MSSQCKYLGLAKWGQQNKTKTTDMKVVEVAAWTHLKSGHMPLRPEAFLGLGGFNIYRTIIFHLLELNYFGNDYKINSIFCYCLSKPYAM